jgi:hypothetical protein
MMKHTFAKKALLLSAFSIFISNFSVHAMDDVAAGAPMDPAVQQEVTTKTGLFAGWNQEALRTRLDNAMKELDRAWKCVKPAKAGGIKCTGGQIKAITGILTTILAIVGALTYGVAYRSGYLAKRPWLGAPGRAVGRGVAGVRRGVGAAGEAVSSRIGSIVKPM